MNFRTQIPFSKKSNNPIDHTSKILLFGSCFSENIGAKFNYFKFKNAINPFGILFHPIAIEKLILNAINQKKYTKDDVFFHNERWHCFDAHSELSNPSKEVLLQNLNKIIESTYQQLNNSTDLIITLGTSWVYRDIESNQIVANCHKVPQKNFLKELLSVDEIMASLEDIITLVKSINPTVNIIFTVSPVRHLKNGFTENNLSKAHLISAIHQVVEPINHIHYFESYEIMMDDLRDYRFYESDMIHPNKTAIDYIWEQFKNSWIHPSSFETMNEVDTIQKGLAHRPFNESSEHHQQFLQKLQLKIKTLNTKHNIYF
ncbi:MAG: GSCFA domain-containing protein [Flavobacteriaceae bacterium]|nr:GSCFA domain-containing protein [Flavobacteriaceae bacterium]